MTELDVKTVSTLDDKELDHLIKILNQEKIDRKKAKKQNLLDTFQEAWEAIEAEGYDFFTEKNLLILEILKFIKQKEPLRLFFILHPVKRLTRLPGTLLALPGRFFPPLSTGNFHK